MSGRLLPGGIQGRLRRRGSGSWGGLWTALLATGLLLSSFLPRPLAAQTAQGFFRDAEQPPGGEVWLDLAPTFESWNAQFAKDSPLDTIPDGAEEPLEADFDGPVLDRVFGAEELILAPLRADAEALGYDSLPRSELSLGSLSFEEFHRNRRSVPLDLEVGLLDRVSATVRAPFVRSEVEAFFAWDSAGATFAPAEFAFPESGAFLQGFSSARDSLKARLEGGDLPEERRDSARALLDRSGAFLSTLSRRVEENWLLPLAGTRSGDAMLQRLSNLRNGLSEFGINAPDLDLAGAATTEALQGFFTGGRMAADSLLSREFGWTLREVELGIRVGLLDTYRGREPPSDSVLRAVRDTMFPDTVPPDSLSPADSAALRRAAREAAYRRRRSGGLELRTTVGALARLPTGPADEAPFVTPATFLDEPVGDGSQDLELTVYQDLRLGSLEVKGNVRYGIQQANDLDLRVHPPDRPFAPAAAAATVRRDPGDYLRVRVAPRVRLNPSFALGAEYTYWRKDPDTFELVNAGDDGFPESADPLAVESEERRQRLGVGLFYSARNERTPADARPVEAGFVFQVAASGSGGQTPVSQLTTFLLRVPIGAF